MHDATLTDEGRHMLSTRDIASLETWTANGLGLHDIARRDPGLAARVHRAVMPLG